MFPKINNDSTTLVTFDLKSLYTSVPHNYGLEANVSGQKNIQTLYIRDFQKDLYWKV